MGEKKTTCRRAMIRMNAEFSSETMQDNKGTTSQIAVGEKKVILVFYIHQKKPSKIKVK